MVYDVYTYYMIFIQYIFVLPFVFLPLKHVWRQNGKCWQRSLNVTEDRITLVDIRYDGKKWLEGPNGRRLAMVVWETQCRRHMASHVTSGCKPWHAFGSCFFFSEIKLNQTGVGKNMSQVENRNIKLT